MGWTITMTIQREHFKGYGTRRTLSIACITNSGELEQASQALAQEPSWLHLVEKPLGSTVINANPKGRKTSTYPTKDPPVSIWRAAEDCDTHDTNH